MSITLEAVGIGGEGVGLLGEWSINARAGMVGGFLREWRLWSPVAAI